METNKKTVVVLSRNYSTGLSVIRSVGAAGYTVDLVASAFAEGRSEVASCSKYVRNSVEVVSKKVKYGKDSELVDALLKFKSAGGEKPVLFPTDDYTASVMDLNRSRLEDIFIMPTALGNDDGCMTRLMDKGVQAEIAQRVGLLTPKEWIISLENEVEVPTDMVYPCFVKPAESITGYKREMAACADFEELDAHLNKLRSKYPHRSVIVQEFLNIDNEIDMGGVCLGDEVIIPAIIRKTNVAQYEKGVTLSGKVVPFEELGELCEKVCAMMREYRYFGMFDLELNIVGDKIYFNEVNLRSGGPNYSYFKSGVNLPALFVKAAFGEEIAEEEKHITDYGKSFIYEKVAWEDHINGYMRRSQLKKCIAASDITLLHDDDDPAPTEVFRKSIKGSRLRHIFITARRSVRSLLRQYIYPILRPIKHFLLGYPQTKRRNRRDPNADKPRVLVCGRNYCSNLCMARSVGKAGYEVEVLRIFQVRPRFRRILRWIKPDAYSKYVKGYYVCVSRRNSARIVDNLIKIATLDENYGKKMLLIPADDLVACVADENYDILSQYYILPDINGKEGEISRMMSKGVQKQLAADFGLPVLNSCVISSYNGEFEIPDSVSYPCFMKPNVSKNSAKKNMRRCDSRQELWSAISELASRKDVELLVEDFVDIGREYSLLGLSTRDGVIGPGFFVAEEGGQVEHRGVAIVGRLLDCADYKPLIDKLIDFVETLGYNGLFDIDLIETKDGKMYFVELNLRYGASGYALTESGVNLPGMYADYMVFGKKPDLNTRMEQSGKRFVSEKVLIDEYTQSRIPFATVKTDMNAVDINFIRDENDKKPYRHFRRYWLAAWMTRGYLKRREAREAKQNDA